jgi:hypothetical protein
MNLLKLTSVAVIVCLLVAGAYLLSGRRSVTDVSSGTAASNAVITKKLPLLIEQRPQDNSKPTGQITPQTNIAPATLQIEPNILANQLEKSSNYRTFVESLYQSRAGGRSLYAATILVSCSGVQANPAYKINQQSASVAQHTARELMHSRCADFTQDELSADSQLRVTRDPRMAEDRYRSVLNTWSKVQNDKAERAKVIKEVLDSGDPLFMGFMSNLFMRAGTTSAFFDGEEFTQPYAQVVVLKAWLAATCEGTSTACGSGDRYVVDACAGQNLCAPSRYELMLQDVYSNLGGDAAIMYKRIYTALVIAIRNRNVDAFNRV